MATKVLIVDDSSFFRKRLREIVESDPTMEVVGEAKDGKEGVELTTKLRPDVITMDVEMPVMDGITAVAEIMKNFEKELSRPSAIRKYIDGEVAPKQFVEQYRLPFLGRWKHCLEFWVAIADHQAIPSDIEMAILVATLYVDAPDPQHARIHVVSVFENLIDVLGDRYNTFREIIDKALGNLVVVERGE